ncbi:phosphocholine-specific phospholipase C [Paucibacter soli]|uniref:phosphocholine-specific phospholipase C n=1 Tax=Paucibacter soli TaxID=3133433 RepID=UPI0030A6E98B
MVSESAGQRRDFLRRLARGAGLAAWSGGFPPVIRAALEIPAQRRSGTLQDVEHIVVLTQENRSFDHYFGSLAGVRGFGDPHPVPLAGGHTVFAQPRQDGGGLRLPPFHLDTAQDFALMRAAGTPHNWQDAQAAWDQGRLGDWPAAKGEAAMGHYREGDIPFQFALARAFTLCDHYHCAVHSGTNTNRLFLWSGHNDPEGLAGGPCIDNSREQFHPERRSDYRWTTYAERLQAAGIRWQVYQDMEDNFHDNPLAGFAPFRDAWYRRRGHSQALRERGISSRSLAQLKADVLADELPQVSWIIATAEGSEHPDPSSPASGADYTARVLEALIARPEVWARTVLLLNFDENDGYFDHMPPPAPPSRDGKAWAGASTVDTRGEYHLRLQPGEDAHWLGRPYGLGPRVPLYVISPWSRGGWVNSQVADHSSVIRFIEARFGVHEPLISPWRRAVCGDLSSCFDFSLQPRAELPPLPNTAAPHARACAYEKTQPVSVHRELPVPEQAAGTRPARALPYALQVQLQLQRASLRLRFENLGEAGAVFHVYDRLRPQALPRRYTVEVGLSLQDDWLLDAADPRYDLWVLGPNGFHRHYIGRADGRPEPLLRQLAAPAQAGELHLRLSNPGEQPLQLQLRALRHAEPAPRSLTLAAGAEAELRLPLAANGYWYDLGLRCSAWPDFAYRLAGHLETGADSISDPAMGGRSLLRTDWP